jgi:hypothetical protein
MRTSGEWEEEYARKCGKSPHETPGAPGGLRKPSRSITFSKNAKPMSNRTLVATQRARPLVSASATANGVKMTA